MSLAVYDIAELEKQKGYSCLYCLVVASNYIHGITGDSGLRQTMHIYESARSRNYGLRYWRSEYKLSNTVFFLFEIPIDFYLEKAEKQI